MQNKSAHWIDTFFHPAKREIWPKLESINNTPDRICAMGQYPQASFCLYGPPGTGKSTMVYRVAKALGRGIISINLIGIKKTLELRNIIDGSSVTNAHHTVYISPKNAVYVFDDFDKSILALKAKSDLKAKREHDNMKIFQRINCHRRRRNYDIDPYIIVGGVGDVEDAGHLIDCDSEEKLIAQPNKDESTVKSTEDIQNAIKDFTQVDDDDLTVDSLLDIIQGSCPNSGSIIFAITNKYDEIRTICPRLFRDGRFKPVFVGYPTRDTIEELTQYYWGKSITEYNFIPDVIRIPTARLVNRAVDLSICYKDKEKQFQMFMDHLKYDLENYKLSDTFKDYESCIDSDLLSN